VLVGPPGALSAAATRGNQHTLTHGW
jgi:hypothetical protein